MARQTHANLRSTLSISILLILGFVLGIFAAPKQQPPVFLPVPERVAEVYTPPPLTIPHVDTTVLGAQAIDPVDFVNEINKERAKVNSPALRLNTTLMKAAGMRVQVIKKYQNFSHGDPYEGIELATVLPKLNFHFVYATENIGMGGISAPDFVNGFMHSTSHRENLLDPRLTETGAAITDGPYKQWYVNYAVQLFAIPGGKDEYLGYKPIDRKAYEAALKGIRTNLHPLVWFIGRTRKDLKYSDKQYKKLLRQEYILETLLTRMKKDLPLNNTHVRLIIEYNSLFTA